jgi:tRNA1(Val) A37 N6-methylase TrmN6
LNAKTKNMKTVLENPPYFKERASCPCHSCDFEIETNQQNQEDYCSITKINHSKAF